jgi:hypothetical protein
MPVYTHPHINPSFPVWDGHPEAKHIFFERLGIFKQHKYLFRVSDWTTQTPITESQSTYIRSELIKNNMLPE